GKSSRQQRSAARSQEGSQERVRWRLPRACVLQQHDHHDHRPPGQRAVLGLLGRPGLQGFAQVHAVRGAGRLRSGGPRGHRAGHQEPGRRDQGSRPRSRVVRACAGRAGHPDQLHLGRDPGSPQRLPPAEAPENL
ncbi:MAG: SSU ribosomal protein S11p (S14e), partial [uncultured Ramlibacter sp.]